MASLTTSALSRSWAYIFLSCLFSALSSFSQTIMEESIPPYLVRLCLLQYCHDLAVRISGFTHRISFIENSISKHYGFTGDYHPLMASLLHLKHAFNESDEGVCYRWGE